MTIPPRDRFTDTCSIPHLCLLILFIHIYLVLKLFPPHFKGLTIKRSVLWERERTARGRTQKQSMSTLGLDPDLPALPTSDQLSSAPLSQRGNEETNV